MTLSINKKMAAFSVVAALGLTACGKAPETAEAPAAAPEAAAETAAPLKIGFVYVGPTGDAGWTYAHDEARKALEAKYGDKIETTYVESVKEGADSERVIGQLARTGNDLIFTTSFGYMNPTLKVAGMNPEVKFEHASGYKRADNMGTFFTRAYQGRYLTGLVAGSMTETNVIGYVASFPIPEVIRGINAFTKGALEVNPDVKVKVVWASTWFDPAKEREAAETLMLQGADILTQHTDSAAVVQAAEAKGKFAIGYHSDMAVYGEKAHLTATIHNWEPLYTAKVEAVLNDTWTSEDLWPGIAEGTTDLAPFADVVPAAVRELVDAKKAALKAGEMRVFDGPLLNQAGEVIVAEGETMEDGALLGFNQYVQGVEGALPKN